MLNINEVQVQVKSSNSPLIFNIKSGNWSALNQAAKSLKSLGWQFVGMHPVDRTPIYQLGQCELRRDKSAQYDWLMNCPDGLFGLNGDLMAVTQEAAQYPEATPQHPADILAAEIAANEPHLASRAAKAAELIKSGVKVKNEYNLRYYAQTDRWECDCPDSQHRNLRSSWGAACKHGLTGYIAQRIAQDKDRVAFQRLDSDLDRERARQAPATPPIPQMSPSAIATANAHLDAIHARNATGDAALAAAMKPEGHRPRYEVKGHYYG